MTTEKIRRCTKDKLMLKVFPTKGFIPANEVFSGVGDALEVRQVRYQLAECTDRGYLTCLVRKNLEDDNPLKKHKGLYLYEITAKGIEFRDTPDPVRRKKRKYDETRAKRGKDMLADDLSGQGTLVEEVSPGVTRVTNMYLAGRRPITHMRYDPRTLVNSVFSLARACG